MTPDDLASGGMRAYQGGKDQPVQKES